MVVLHFDLRVPFCNISSVTMDSYMWYIYILNWNIKLGISRSTVKRSNDKAKPVAETNIREGKKEPSACPEGFWTSWDVGRAALDNKKLWFERERLDK